MKRTRQKRLGCGDRAEVVATDLFHLVEMAELCPLHTLTVVAAVMGRALYYAMPDELVNEAIDRAAAMAKELVKVNAGTLDDKDKAVASADFADLVEMIRSIGATKH